MMNSHCLDFHLTIYSSEQIDAVERQMKEPTNGLQIIDRRVYLVSHERCFIGVSRFIGLSYKQATEAHRWLQDRFGWSPDQALFFLCLLATKRLIHNTSDREAKFENNSKDFWRFQSDEPGPLNWKHIRITPVEETPCVIVEKLLKDLLSMLHLASPKTGSNEATIAALARVGSTQAFCTFEKETAVLQRVSLLDLTPDQKLAFWINTWNMLSLHSLISKTIVSNQNPLTNFWERSVFFHELTYVIGSFGRFSLEDILNGILRSTVSYFAADDIRKNLSIEKREPRIHTILTCLTKSSPQPFIVHHHKVETCLNIAAKRFFNRMVTFEENAVVLPKIVNSYQDDFLVAKENIVPFLYPLLQKDQQQNFQKLLKKKSGFSLKFHDFKWEELWTQVDDYDLIFSNF